MSPPLAYYGKWLADSELRVLIMDNLSWLQLQQCGNKTLTDNHLRGVENIVFLSLKCFPYRGTCALGSKPHFSNFVKFPDAWEKLGNNDNWNNKSVQQQHEFRPTGLNFCKKLCWRKLHFLTSYSEITVLPATLGWGVNTSYCLKTLF